jgi:hypothetical protein
MRLKVNQLRHGVGARPLEAWHGEANLLQLSDERRCLVRAQGQQGRTYCSPDGIVTKMGDGLFES